MRKEKREFMRSLKRFVRRGEGNIHYGFDWNGDYVYANCKDGIIEVKMQHEFDRECAVHFRTDKPVEDMIFIVECIDKSQTNQDICELWEESGRK